MKHDPVNHPQHYSRKGIEAIDVIEAFGLGFHLGNVVKYILRAGRKSDGDEDLRKARWYLDRRLDGKKEPPPPLYYLATPYSKYRGGIEVAFRHAAELAANLLKAGHKVYSPIAHTHPLAVYGELDPLDHSIWLPFDEAMMRVCDSLLVAHMDGWKESKGVLHEIAHFTKAGKPIFDLDPVTLAITPFRRFATYGAEDRRADFVAAIQRTNPTLSQGEAARVLDTAPHLPAERG